MIDQFIYTRADGTKRSNANGQSFGFGLTHFTDGIPAIRTEVSDASYYVNRLTDCDGQRIRILRKQTLADGLFCIQQSLIHDTTKETGRDTPMTHGYVFSESELPAFAADPDAWFSLPFIEYNVNAQDVHFSAPDLTARGAALRPLREVLAEAGLSPEHFITAVCGAFDALENEQLILLELDYRQPGAYALAAQLLRWIYHFLPLAMRRRAGFTTCFDERSSGSVFCYGIIPAESVQLRGGELSVRSRTAFSIGSGYLFARGLSLHYSYGEGEDGMNGLFCSWLSEVIRHVYRADDPDSRRELAVLDGIYRSMEERLISSLSPEKQTACASYDAAAWFYLSNPRFSAERLEEVDRAIAPERFDERAIFEAMLDFRGNPAVEALVPEMLLKTCEACRKADFASWLPLLKKLRGFVPEETAADADLVSELFLIRAMEADREDGASRETEACARILELPEGSPIPENALFPSAREDKVYRDASGLDFSGEAAGRRLLRWVAGTVSCFEDLGAYLTRVESLAARVSGFQADHREAVFAALPRLDAGRVKELAVRAGLEGLAACCAEPELIFRKTGISSDTLTAWFYALEKHARRQLEAASAQEDSLRLMEKTSAAFEAFADIPEAASCWAEMLCGQLKKLNTRSSGSRFPDGEDTLAGMMKQLRFLYGLTASAAAPQDALPLMRTSLALLLVFLLRDSRHLTRAQLAGWEEQCPFPVQLDDYPSSHKNLIALALALGRFARSPGSGFADFQEILNSMELGKAAQEIKRVSLLKCVELFLAGRWPGLDPVLADYGFYRSEGKLSHSVILSAVLEQSGGDALIKLLELYPSAALGEAPSSGRGGKNLLDLLNEIIPYPEAQQEEAPAPREGAYPWMKTSPELFRALDAALGKPGLLERLFADDGSLAPRLVGAVLSLAPEGSVLAEDAQELCRKILEAWKRSGNRSGDVKKELRELKRKGAFG